MKIPNHAGRWPVVAFLLYAAGSFIASAAEQQVTADSSAEILKSNAADAERLLRRRIAEQSEGRIKLVNFRPIIVRPGDLELGGARTYTFSFQADIEFAQPCKWASRFEGQVTMQQPFEQ